MNTEIIGYYWVQRFENDQALIVAQKSVSEFNDGTTSVNWLYPGEEKYVYEADEKPFRVVPEQVGPPQDLKQFRVEAGESAQEILSAVVYPRIYDGKIFWHGLVSLPSQNGQALFNEVRGKTKLEAVINLSTALGAFIHRLEMMRRKIDVIASETL